MNNFWLNLPKPFTVMAPMDGVTDFVFREIICDLAKPNVMFTEFVSAEGLLKARSNKLTSILQYSNRQKPVVAQIWGTKPEFFYKAAQLVQNLGFDGIDINMGCPVKTVTKTGSGSALIKNKSLAQELIKATFEGATNIPVSVKTRIGYNVVQTQEWLSFLLGLNLQAITIHARTSANLSKTPADWQEIKKAVNLKNQISPSTVIVGNGDVKSYAEVLEKEKKYLVDGVMIGRGVFSNPWVFSKETDGHTHCDYLNLLLKHTKLFVDTYDDNRNFEDMKKFFKIYVKSFRGAKSLMNKLMGCKNYTQVEKLVLPFCSMSS